MAKKSKLKIAKPKPGDGLPIGAKKTVIKRVGVVAVGSGTICVVDPMYGSDVEKLEREDIARKKFTIVSKQHKFPTTRKTPFAVVHITGIGDGFFPVDAEYEGRHVRRLIVQLPGDFAPTVPKFSKRELRKSKSRGPR